MRPRSTLLALLVLAGAVAAPTAGAGAPPRDRCHRPDVRTVALTGQLRVVADDDTGFYYACLRSTGRRTLLWEQDDLYSTGVTRAVAGRFAAYTVGTSPACKADCPPDVHGSVSTAVTDARTRRTRQLSDASVWSVRLAPSGTVAWASGSTLMLWPLGARREVLSTRNVHDIEVSGGRLRWSDDDGSHSTPFA
jgi:hypothetical protein